MKRVGAQRKSLQVQPAQPVVTPTKAFRRGSSAHSRVGNTPFVTTDLLRDSDSESNTSPSFRAQKSTPTIALNSRVRTPSPSKRPFRMPVNARTPSPDQRSFRSAESSPVTMRSFVGQTSGAPRTRSNVASPARPRAVRTFD